MSTSRFSLGKVIKKWFSSEKQFEKREVLQKRLRLSIEAMEDRITPTGTPTVNLPASPIRVDLNAYQISGTLAAPSTGATTAYAYRDVDNDSQITIGIDIQVASVLVPNGISNFNLSPNLLQDQVNKFLVAADDGSGLSTPAAIVPNITEDSTAPTVLSIVRANSDPTNAGTVNFTVTFSENVTGVDATDFTLFTTGTFGTAPTIGAVTGPGRVWNVAVNTGTGDGTIRLDLADDNSIKDILNLPIGGEHPLGGPVAGDGNFSTGQFYTIDKTPPATPNAPDLQAGSDSGTSSTDDITNDNTPTFDITGAEPNQTVELRDASNGNAVVATGTADGTGAATLTASTLSDGVHNLFVRTYDLAGNFADSTALAVTIDTTLATPNAPIFKPAATGGTSSTDNNTNDNTPTFDITGAEPNQTVELRDASNGNAVVATGTADGTGAATLTASTLSDGVHNLFVRTYDLAGNFADSTALAVTIDTTIATPNAPDLVLASDNGASSTDNNTNDNTPTFDITGAEPNQTVELRDASNGNAVVATGTADGTGAATLTASTLSDGVHNLFVRTYDLAGNSADSTALAVTIDTTPPATPNAPDLQAGSDSGTSSTDNNTNDNTPTFDITGAEPNQTVELRDASNGNAVVATGTADGTGAATLTASTLSDGVHNLFVRTYDLAGNSADSTALAVTIDTTPPATPNAPDLQAGSDSGTSSTDNNTNDNTPTFDITGAEPNQTVELRDASNGNAVVATGTADGTGAATLTASTLSDGVHNLFVRTYDLAGNFADSTALAVTIDTTIATPNAPDLVLASDNGASSTDNNTNDNTPTFDITGAEPNQTVELRDASNGNAVVATGTADGTGAATLTASTLSDGVHNLFVRTYDLAGNSADSTALAVTIDTTPPATPNAPDLQAGSDNGASSTDNNTNDNTPTFDITGAEPNQTVELRDASNGNAVVATGTADGTGAATLTASTLSDGVHNLFVRTYDLAGNSADSTALAVTIDTTPPATPNAPDLQAGSDSGTSSTDNNTNDNTPTFDITGAEPNQTVELRDASNGNAVVATGTADGTGAATLTASTLSDGVHNLFVRTYDLAGNSADSTALAVTIDTTPQRRRTLPICKPAATTGPRRPTTTPTTTRRPSTSLGPSPTRPSNCVTPATATPSLPPEPPTGRESRR
ncbi:MAG: Ig-like domain-containing protein [Gemmataceae bacterium]